MNVLWVIFNMLILITIKRSPALEIFMKIIHMLRSMNTGGYLIMLIERIFLKTSVYTEPCIDTAVDNLSENLLENHVPLIKIPNRKLKYCSKPWVDTELQAEIHCKNKLAHIKNTIPNEINKVNFSKRNNHVTSERRKKKKMYLLNYLKLHKHDGKKICAGINFELESSKNVEEIPLSVRDVKGVLLADPQDIADNFSYYFESVHATKEVLNFLITCIKIDRLIDTQSFIKLLILK